MIGDYSIRFENIRQGKDFTVLLKFNYFSYSELIGYRHIQLENKVHKGTIFVGITIQPYESIFNMVNPQYNNLAN